MSTLPQGRSTKPPVVPLTDVPEDIVARMLELGATEEMATVPVYRAMACQPDLLRGWIEMSWGLRTRMGSSRQIREIAIIRMSLHANAGLMRDAHEMFAREAGVPDDRIAAIPDWESSELFTDAERAVLALADGVHVNDISDQVHEELARHFSPEERVELIVTCAFYEMVPRVNLGLRVN